MNSKSKWIITLVVIILGVALVSSGLTALFLTNAASAVDSTAPLTEMLETIEKQYFYYSDEEEEAIVDETLRAMIAATGDDYARYFTAEEYQEYTTSNEGEYTGLGIVVNLPDAVGSLISTVYEDSPAEEAGIRAGDVITVINGVDAANLSWDEFLGAFSEDDAVADEITVLRGGETLQFTALRRVVVVHRVTYELLDEGVGYIRMTEFSGNIVTEFAEALAYLKENGASGIVVDLRGNPGGSLDAVLNVTEQLLDKGSLLVSIRSRSENTVEYRADVQGDTSMPIAVLVNGGSASASELFSGALQDYGRAAIVGTQTFGKGIVQSFFRLRSNGGWVKMTTDAYYTPNGTCIHGTGITPDIVVELPEAFDGVQISDIPHAEDTQLQAAITALAGRE